MSGLIANAITTMSPVNVVLFGAACANNGLCSSVTFWSHLGPDLGFLEDSGYAVLRFTAFGAPSNEVRAVLDELA